MTMKRVISVSFAYLLAVSSVSAAPALVWKHGCGGGGGGGDSSSTTTSPAVVHYADDVDPAAIFDSLLPDKKAAGVDESSSAASATGATAVMFVLGRSDKGTEQLTALAESGSLPGVSARYNNAHCMHHHVSGVTSAQTVARDVSRAHPDYKVVHLSLTDYSNIPALAEEWNQKNNNNNNNKEMEVNTNGGMMSKSLIKSHKRTREILSGEIFIVDVEASTDPVIVDQAVVAAIQDESIKNVILSGQRSIQEVKAEREHEHRRRLQVQEAAGRKVQEAAAARHSNGINRRRRLEEDANQQQQDNQQENQDYSLSGVYYVSLTPNILAGILFFFLFTFITYIGVSCMGMIAGQDVYVHKMPSIGREA